MRKLKIFLSDKDVSVYLDKYMNQIGFYIPYLVHKKHHPCYVFYEVDTPTGFNKHYGDKGYSEQQKIKNFLKNNGFISNGNGLFVRRKLSKAISSVGFESGVNIGTFYGMTFYI